MGFIYKKPSPARNLYKIDIAYNGASMPKASYQTAFKVINLRNFIITMKSVKRLKIFSLFFIFFKKALN